MGIDKKIEDVEHITKISFSQLEKKTERIKALANSNGFSEKWVERKVAQELRRTIEELTSYLQSVRATLKEDRR